MINTENLPNKPGVYIFKAKNNKPLYVGKALNIKRRVKTHLKNQTSKEVALSKKSVSINTILVDSEIEALILEANLIKKFKPFFNESLKDDKDYLYIKIQKEAFPRVLLARKRDLKNSRVYFGPFPQARAARLTLRKLRKIFPYRLCNVNQDRACLSYHISLCPGVCIGKINEKDYLKNINNLIRFLKGDKKKLLQELKKEMQKTSRKMEFEQSNKIKRTIEAINYVTSGNFEIQHYLKDERLANDLKRTSLEELQRILNLNSFPQKIEAYDISNFFGKEMVGSMVVFINGRAENSFYRRFKIKEVNTINDYAALEEVFRRRFKAIKGGDVSFSKLPNLIVIDGGKGQLKVATKVLKNLNLEIPAIALAKKEEKIYVPNQKTPLTLKLDSASLHLIQQLRDEAHRFALFYHRLLRKKAFINNKLVTVKINEKNI